MEHSATEKNKEIKNIMFDMGGVLFDLNATRCIEAFEAIGASKTAGYVRDFRTEDLFYLIEMSSGTTAQFCNEVRTLDGISASDEEITVAWNALLEPTPQRKRDELLALKADGYRLFLLSNTNEIHWQRAKTLIAGTEHDVSDIFERIFLSYEMNLRKPDKEIFRQLMTVSGISPEDTLFIDDNAANIEAAQQLGISTFHETDGHRWIDTLKTFLA